MRTEIDLEEGRQHIARVVEQLAGSRLQLLGVLLLLPETAPDREEEARVTWDGEMRSVIECVLHDYIRPTLDDLQDLLANPCKEQAIRS